MFVFRFLPHFAPPIIPSGATSSNRFAAPVPADIGPAELRPLPEGASGAGVAVMYITCDEFQDAAEDAVVRFGRAPYLIMQIGEERSRLSSRLTYEYR